MVSLRALKRSDSENILQWCNDPELKFLTGTLYPISSIEHEKWFESKACEPLNKLFIIEDKKNKIPIGVIGCKETDLINRNTEMYIYIGEKEYWGKGYGSDAISTFTSFCFNELNLHRVYLYVFSYNERAIRSYEKVGFKIEGRLRDSVYKKGCYYDKILMAILKNE